MKTFDTRKKNIESIVRSMAWKGIKLEYQYQQEWCASRWNDMDHDDLKIAREHPYRIME